LNILNVRNLGKKLLNWAVNTYCHSILGIFSSIPSHVQLRSPSFLITILERTLGGLVRICSSNRINGSVFLRPVQPNQVRAPPLCRQYALSLGDYFFSGPSPGPSPFPPSLNTVYGKTAILFEDSRSCIIGEGWRSYADPGNIHK
jgi:hypothetical protein